MSKPTHGIVIFTAFGNPETKGSARAFVRGKTANGTPRAIVTNDNPRCKAWSAIVAARARLAIGLRPPIAGPVSVDVTFFLKCPKSIKGRKQKGYEGPLLDLDKLLRAFLDALTGIVYIDDKQVVMVQARKEWGTPGASVSIVELDPDGVAAAPLDNVAASLLGPCAALSSDHLPPLTVNPLSRQYGRSLMQGVDDACGALEARP